MTGVRLKVGYGILISIRSTEWGVYKQGTEDALLCNHTSVWALARIFGLQAM